MYRAASESRKAAAVDVDEVSRGHVARVPAAVDQNLSLVGLALLHRSG